MNINHAPSGESFAAFSEHWLSSCRDLSKASSLVRYRNLLHQYLLPTFGPLPLSEISQETVTFFLEQLMHTGGVKGKGLSPKTAADILSVLRCVCRFAAQNEGQIAPDLRSVSIRQQTKPLRVFSRTEQEKLTAWLRNSQSLTHLGILLSLFTGLRIGELCALRWKDISLEERCLHVRATLQRLQKPFGDRRTEIVLSSPKSPCSLRSIPLPDPIQALMVPKEKPGPCFFLTGTTKHVEPRTVENRFKAVCANVGSTTRAFTAAVTASPRAAWSWASMLRASARSSDMPA